MDILYTEYAKQTIVERNIEKEKIETTIFNPDETIQGKNERKIAHKIFQNKLLRVIYETYTNTYIVITAYYTKPERYMKNENKL